MAELSDGESCGHVGHQGFDALYTTDWARQVTSHPISPTVSAKMKIEKMSLVVFL